MKFSRIDLENGMKRKDKYQKFSLEQIYLDTATDSNPV